MVFSDASPEQFIKHYADMQSYQLFLTELPRRQQQVGLAASAKATADWVVRERAVEIEEVSLRAPDKLHLLASGCRDR